MVQCLRREELVLDLRRALSEFSEDVIRLRAAVKQGETFAQQRSMMELTRLQLDSARKALELHLANHNC